MNWVVTLQSNRLSEFKKRKSEHKWKSGHEHSLFLNFKMDSFNTFS